MDVFCTRWKRTGGAVFEGQTAELAVGRQGQRVGEVVFPGQFFEQVDAVAPATVNAIVFREREREIKGDKKEINGVFKQV